MKTKQRTAKTTVREKRYDSFTDEERSAMQQRVRELKRGANVEQMEADVLAKIASMKSADRALAERIHAIAKGSSPEITSRLWYGMPAYAKDDKTILYFQDAAKFKSRYAKIGFSDKARLDDGTMWPIEFALTEKLTAADEAKIKALIKKALG